MGRWSEVDVESTIPECFARQVALHPNHPATAGAGRSLTYAELDELAGRFANLIAEHWTARGRVALLLSHDAPVVAAALAALRLGMSAVTLNPSDPPTRLAQIRAEVEPAVLLTDEPYLAQARDAGFPDRDIAMLSAAPGESSQLLEPSPPDPDDIAFLICTSGSTGRPKVVMQTHRNQLHNVLRYTNGLGIRHDDRLAWLASLSGGQGLATAWTALLNGATLCPFPIMSRGVKGLGEWLEHVGATIFDTLPSILRSFVGTLDNDRSIAGVRVVRLASEPARRADFDAYRRHFQRDSVLASVLGSSETGIIAHSLIRPDESVGEGQLHVGTAAEGMEVLLLDGSGHSVGQGEIGEIIVRSRYLSPGYWRNPGLTCERFFDSSSGLREFRSGDLARLSTDGHLVVVGRADTQVKVHGHRLQLEEVEAALGEHPAVAAAAVAVRDSETGGRLTAYLIPAGGQDVNPSKLRDSLTATLPPHAIPVAFICVDQFPLTPHGKVDRERLSKTGPPRRVGVRRANGRSDAGEALAGSVSSALEPDDHDDRVEVGGMVVSLPKIERVLRHHPRVDDARVVGVRGTEGRSQLVAYVESRSGVRDGGLEDELHAWCERRLQPYEHPDLVTIVSELPATTDGQLQRSQLQLWAAELVQRRSAVISLLLRTWSELFSLPVSEGDDFFALGGDSLSASELIFAIGEELGVELALGDLLAAPTVRQLARVIVSDRDRSGDAPVCVASRGESERRLFFAPGIGDSVIHLRSLGEALEPEIVVYGMPAWERIPAANSVRDEAQRLAAGLRVVQPSGPYWLGGHSSGGVIALEIARVLEERGERVAGLVLLDAPLGTMQQAPPVPRPSMRRLRGVTFRQRIAAYVAALRSPGPAIRRVYGRVGLADWLDERIWTADLRRRRTVRASRRLSYRWTMEARAVEQYSPGPCDGPVTLLRCPDALDPIVEEAWAEVSQGGLAIRPLDMPHGQMLERPYVARVAEEIRIACPWPLDPALPSGSMAAE